MLAERAATDSFWEKVDTSGECWLWKLSRNPNGYGQVTVRGRKGYAHRYAYELAVGPIPAGLTVDHLCRVKHCCNPSHMEIVTRGENARRYFRTITHCRYGHLLDGFTKRKGREGSRYCTTCDHLRKERQCRSAA